MHTLLLALVLLNSGTGGYQDAGQPLLVAEDRADYSVRDGVLELRSSGGGWLRTPRLYLDFSVAFDFKTGTAPSDAGVLIRTWIGREEWPRRGYRITLPSYPGGGRPFILVGHSQKVSVVQQATPPIQVPDEWQHIEITGEGRKITIALNGTTVGIYEVERYGGHVLFDNRKGRVQFRNIRISETEPKAPGLVNAPPWVNEKITQREGPKLVREVRPIYTPEAMKRGVQGEVHMTVVVMPDGSTSAVHVTRSLDPDLDLSAIAAVREWKFKPGLINGRPVPMFAEVEMTFQVLRR